MTGYASRIERFVDLRRRIHRVVDFIDENLDADLSLENLADIACISRFHFQRVFTRMAGRSPAEIVRQLRLMRAAQDIVDRRHPVGAAATTAGYTTPQAFARAFRREFGRTAREMRADQVQTAQKPKPIEFTIVERQPTKVNALMHDDVRTRADALSVDSQSYANALGKDYRLSMGVYFDDLLTPYDQRIRLAMCFIGEPQTFSRNTQVQRLHIDGGTYACFAKHGLLVDLTPQWPGFLNETLPMSGWMRRSGPVLRQFISDRATTPPSQRLCYIYVPVEPLVSH